MAAITISPPVAPTTQCFYAAEALLIVEGLTFSKHSAVIGEFTRLFVRPGKLPENLAIDFREAFEQRGVGDYGFVENLPPETAARVIANAATFVDAVERLLREEAETCPPRPGGA